MAKTEEETKKQGDRNQNRSGDRKKQDEKKGGDKKKQDEKKGEKKGGKKEEKEYKPGMPSWMYDPCPHRVWTPKPGERDKSEPRGAGSPWNEPGRKYEDVKKEEEEKSKKKEEKAAQKRDKAREEKQKTKDEEEKKKKEDENKKKEEEKKREEKKKAKEKQKKKKEDEKRQKQKEEREKKKKEEEEKRKKEEEDRMKDKEDSKKKGGKGGKDKDKDKKAKKKEEPLPVSYMFEPCPHKVYTPGPGEKDLADPRGVGSPWYVPTKKKEDIEKEEAEREEEDSKKRTERSKKHKKEKKEKEKREEEKKKKEEAKQRRREEKLKEIRDQRRKEREEKRQEREREERQKYMGEGVSPNKTDFAPELMLMFDFISGVDDEEREKRGETLQMRKEEIEQEMESHLAKEAFTNDFKELVSTFVEAEWGKADKRLKELKRDERRRRREVFKNMDPLAKEMMAEGTRFNTMYKGAMGIKESEKEKNGHGKPSAMEDIVVSLIMQQMDNLLPPQPTVSTPTRRSRSLLTAI